MKKIIGYSLLIFLVSVSFLFSPRQNDKGPNGQCPLNYVSLNRFMGVIISCDSYVFVGGALHPSFLLKQNYERQARPLYIIIGNLLGYGIYYLSTPLHPSVESYLDKKFAGTVIQKQSGNMTLYFSVFSGFIIFNFLLLLLSFVVFEKLLQTIGGTWQNEEIIFILFLLCLVSNQLVKNYFWTPHQQMFNILTPLLGLLWGMQILKKEKLPAVLAYSFLSGIILLIYGNAILLLAAVGISYLLKNFRPQKIVPILLTLLLIAFIFLIPTLLWILLLKTQGTSYYNHEVVNHREFVWITDCINTPGLRLLPQLAHNSFQFLKTFGSLLFPVALLVFIALCRKSAGKGVVKNEPGINNATSFIVLMIVVTLLFYWLLGYYTDRLTYTIAPYLIVLSAMMINTIRLTKKMKYLFIFLAVAYHFLIVIFNPVHFSDLFYY